MIWSIIKKSDKVFLPRMFSNDKTVIPNYMSMYGAPEFSFNYDNEDIANDKDAYAAFEAMKKKNMMKEVLPIRII